MIHGSPLLQWAGVNTDVCQHLGPAKLRKLERHWAVLVKKGQKKYAVKRTLCEISQVTDCRDYLVVIS